MPTDCNAPLLAFEGFEGREVVGGFDGGALVLREADRAIGLTRRVAHRVVDRRDPDLVVHQVETLKAQREHAQALGYEDVADHDELHNDPELGLLSDTLVPKRADAGFARDAMKSWCEQNRVEYVFGMARNKRLEPMIAGELREAKATFETSKKAARVFKELDRRTKKSWSKCRRVVAKAKNLEKGTNPRFIVTSLPAVNIAGAELYEMVYCARGENENRIQEFQLDLNADRTSAATMRANQVRMWFASHAYVLIEAVRRLALHGTEMADARACSIRLRLLRLGAVVTVSVRRIKIAFATACPANELLTTVIEQLRASRDEGPPIAVAA